MQYNLLSRSYKSSLCFSLWDTLYLYPSEFKNGDLILQVKVRKLSLEDIGLAAWLNLQVALLYEYLQNNILQKAKRFVQVKRIIF